MSSQYFGISKVIAFIKNHPKPPLFSKDLFLSTGLTINDFETILNKWAGINFEFLLENLSPTHNLDRIRNSSQTVLFDVQIKNFFPNFSEFVKIIPMCDAEFSDPANKLKINYGFYNSPFGKLIVGSTTKGVCYMAFEENEQLAVNEMESEFEHSELTFQKDDFQTTAISVFELKESKPVLLNLRCTPFQLKVWNQLLETPFGKLTTYHQLAKELEMPTASRAVGTAIGRNPVAFIVPCHRVVQSTGEFGGYKWGEIRKVAISIWEQAQIRK